MNPLLRYHALLDGSVVPPLPSTLSHEDATRWQYRANARWRAVARWSWAVPTPVVVATIAGLGPIIETGAGTGYWARLVAAAGGDVIATDDYSWNEVHGVPVRFGRWHPVERMSAVEAVAAHPDRVWLTVWPPMDMGDEIDVYGGSTIVYVGEADEGCTGSARFHEALAGFDLVACLPIPQWWGLHDQVTIWTRPSQIGSDTIVGGRARR